MELLLGRLLAVAVHPVLAWRHLRSPGRAVLALGFAGAAYLTTLIALFVLKAATRG